MSFPRTVFWKILEINKIYPKKTFFWQFGLIKIHSRSPKLWYTISHTSSSQNRMKLCTLLPYVLPQDYFLENSGISEKLSQKTHFSVNLDLEKIRSRSLKCWYTIPHISSDQKRIKLCRRLLYVIPQDYFLENSGNSKNLSQKTRQINPKIVNLLLAIW